MEGKVKNVDNEKEEKLKGMVKEQEREKEGLKRAGDIEKESMRKEHVTVLENMSHKMNKGKERSQRLSIDITRLQKLLEDAQTKLQGYEENQGALLKKYQDDNQRHKQELKEAKQRAKDLGRDLEEAKLNERDRKVISPTLTKINQKVLEEQRELTNKLQELNSNLETRLIQSQNENSNKTKEIAKLQDMHDTKVKELDNLNKELHNRVKESELKLNKIEENLHHTNKNSEQKVSVMMEEHHFEKDNLHMIHNQEKKDLHLAHSHEKEATREEFMKEMTDKDSKNKKEVKEHKESAIKLKNINAALQAKLSHSEKQFAEKLEELDNLQNTHEKKMKKLDNENSELVKQIKDSDHRKIQISENLDNAHKNIKQKMEEYHFEKENLHLIHNQEKKDLHLAHSHEKEATREEFMKEMTDKDSKNKKEVKEHKESAIKLKNINAALQAKLSHSEKQFAEKLEELDNLQNTHEKKMKKLDNENSELVKQIKDSDHRKIQISENLDNAHKNIKQKMEEYHFEKENLHLIHNQEKKDLHLAHSHEKEATREEFMKEMTDKDSKNKKEVKEHKESAIKLKNINAALQAKLSHSEKQFAEKLEELDNLQNTHERKMKILERNNSELVSDVKDREEKYTKISENLDNAHKNIKEKKEEHHMEKENLQMTYTQEKEDLHLAHSQEKEASRDEFMAKMREKDSKMNRKKGKVQRSAKENADLASQLADARAQLQDYEENQNFLLKKHQDENNGCRAELKESRQMVKMLTKNIEDLKQIIETPARISPRISEADARLIEDNRNLIKTLKDENSTLEYKFITSQTEIAAKNTKISSLEGLLEGQIDEYKKYKNSNDKLTLENKNKLKEYELMIENHKLFENDQNKRFSTKVSDLQKEKDENVKHLENLNNQIQENEKFANNEREDLTSRVNRKIGKKNRLLNDNNQLMKELEEARDIIKEYEENANTLIRKHQEERNNNKLEIKDKGHKLKSLTEAFNEIVQRKAEHPLEESQNEHQLKLRQQNNILTTRINELQGEHEAQLIEMNKDKNNTEERIIKLERELSQCREELAEDKVSADKKYAEYENKLDKSNQIIENYKLIEIENIKSLTAKQKSWEREKKQNLKQIQDLGIHLEDTHQKQESTKTKYLGELAMINSKLSKKSGKKQRLQGNYEETRLELEAAKIKLKEYEENRENLLKRHQDQIKDNQIELKLHKTKLNWFNRNYDETRDKPDTQIIYAEEPIQMKEIEEQKQIIQNLGKINTKLEERLIASQIQNSERSEEIGNLSHELKAVQNEFESQRAKYENTIADQNMKLNEANLQIKNYHLENENTMNIRTHKNHIKLLQNEKDKEIRKLRK